MQTRDLLHKYSTVVTNDAVCQIESSDLAYWKEYYSILVDQAVILGEKFFTCDDGEFVLESGTMSARIYWYILHSLYSYIFRTNVIRYTEDLVPLKTEQRISYMETYISTIYKMKNGEEFCVAQYDEQTWDFLDVKKTESPAITTQAGFFKELCKSDEILFSYLIL